MPDQPNGGATHDGSGGATSFGIDVQDDGDDVVIFLSGDVDLAIADDLWKKVERVIPAKGRLIFDLAATTFMDSTGLSVMVRAHQVQPDLVLRSPTRPVRRILELTGIDALVFIEGDGSGPHHETDDDGDAAGAPAAL